MNQEVKTKIFEMSQELSRYQVIDFIFYLLETTDLTMKEIGELTGRSESGVYRINAGQRHNLGGRKYPVRSSRGNKNVSYYSEAGYFSPTVVISKLNDMLTGEVV